MGNGRVIATVRIMTEQPLPYLPRPDYYLRTVAEDEDCFSEGRLWPSEAHAIFHYTLHGRGECSVGARTYPVTAGQGFLQVVNDPACGYRYPRGGTEDWAFCCFRFSGGNTLALMNDMIKAYGPVFTIDAGSPTLRRSADEERWLACPTIGRMESAEPFYSLIFTLASLGERARDRAANEQLRAVPHTDRASDAPDRRTSGGRPVRRGTGDRAGRHAGASVPPFSSIHRQIAQALSVGAAGAARVPPVQGNGSVGAGDRRAPVLQLADEFHPLF